MTRKATSPRFAIRIFLNISRAVQAFGSALCGGPEGPHSIPHAVYVPSRRLDREQPLAVLHRLPVLHVDIGDFPFVLGVDLVHQLHCFDDAEHLPLLHGRTDLHKRRRPRLRGAIEGADDRRLDHGELDLRPGRVAGAAAWGTTTLGVYAAATSGVVTTVPAESLRSRSLRPSRSISNSESPLSRISARISLTSSRFTVPIGPSS